MSYQNSCFVCQSCGHKHTKWSGKCEACSSWNTLVEEISSYTFTSKKSSSKKDTLVVSSLEDIQDDAQRMVTNITEFDRVTGGGLVKGSVVLIGGDPGIGKSTLLLQILANLSKTLACLYISGEESLHQIRLRSKRLGLDATSLLVSSMMNVEDIVGQLNKNGNVQVLVIDSIQTMYLPAIESAPGTVSQVRASAHELIQLAKKQNITILLVGHVTKEGLIAGPRVLEHMVDTVLYFEGERHNALRVLRAVKNRFGATDEMGIFEMTSQGLKDVGNLSSLFLNDRHEAVSGVCVFSGMEGNRPILVEMQSLIARSPLALPRRTVVGWDSSRLSMVLAVLETRCGLSLSGKDVFLNVAGGFKIQEPAADLAVAACILSSILFKPIPYRAIIFGEIGLSGEIRSVPHVQTRLKEAAKLGFEVAFMPSLGHKKNIQTHGLQIQEFKSIQDICQWFGFKKERKAS